METRLSEAEERYRALFERSLDCVFISDFQGNFLDANHAALTLLGYRREEIASVNYKTLLHPEDLPQAYATLREIVHSGTSPGVKEYRLRKKDGDEVIVEIKSSLVYSEGEPRAVQGIARDITERKRAEGKLLLQSAALNAAADAIIISNRNGTIEWVNQSFSTLTGYSAEEVIGKNPRILKSGRQEPEFYRRMFDTIHGGSVWRGEVVNRYKDGREAPEEMTITPVRGADGEIEKFIAIKHDITARKQAETALRDSERKLAFHLMNTPIGAIEWNRDFQVVEWNLAAEQMFGYARAEVLGKHASFIVPESFRTALDQLWPRILNQRGGTRSTNENVAKSGKILHCDWFNTPLKDDQGRIIGVTSLVQDITERELAEAKIRRLNRVYAVLSGINTTIVRVKGRQELFNEACRIAVEHGQFAMAWIGALEAATQDVTPVAWAGEGAEAITRIKSSAQEDIVHGQGTVERSIRERRPLINNSIAARGFGGPRWKEIVRLGIQSQITLPLFEDQAVVGTLTMYAREPNFFNEDELRLLSELAADISFALENISRQQKLEKLARIRAVSGEINAAIVRIRDREALLRETCRIATEHGKFEMIWIGAVDTAKQEIRPAAWAGFSAEAANRVSWKSIRNAQGTLGEAVLTRKPAVRNDIETQLPVGGLRDEAVQRGCRSTVCMPLVVDDSVVALIALFASGKGFFDSDELGLLVEMAADVSFALQSIAQEEKVQYLSYYDSLTALPNRSLFIDRLNQQMHGRGEEQPMVTLILLNLERFRYINESLGRNGGDDLLKLVAQRLESCFHGKDCLARIGADGFGVVIRGMRDAAAVAHALQAQVLGCFHEPFQLNGSELRVAVKAGVALFPADGGDGDTLFKNAEAALKNARNSGERFMFYTAEMNSSAAQILSLETRLRKAVESQEFVLHYQPKINLASGEICGLEALIRWQDPDSGLVAPGAFIPLLEETGLILEVGKWALATAQAQHREWTARGLAAPRIAVNVSAIQLQQKNFSDIVIDVVHEHGDNPGALELEVTESLLMKDVQASIGKLSILRGLGITIAMDDFGTGYSSLAYLARLPINSVKIDRTFITGMARGPEDMGIVTTIIALAHSMNLKVVAEGVETEEQSKLLRLLQCDEAQGFLFSKPLPAAEIEPLLRTLA